MRLRNDAIPCGMRYYPPMPRPKLTPQGSVQSAFRMSPDIWERASDLIEFVSARRGVPSTRTDVLREAIVRGLVAIEKERDKADK